MTQKKDSGNSRVVATNCPNTSEIVRSALTYPFRNTIDTIAIVFRIFEFGTTGKVAFSQKTGYTPYVYALIEINLTLLAKPRSCALLDLLPEYRLVALFFNCKAGL